MAWLIFKMASGLSRFRDKGFKNLKKIKQLKVNSITKSFLSHYIPECIMFFYLNQNFFVLETFTVCCVFDWSRLQNLWRHHRHYCVIEGSRGRRPSATNYEKPIYRGSCLKRGAWTVWRFNGGFSEKERVVFLRGVDNPTHNVDKSKRAWI